MAKRKVVSKGLVTRRAGKSRPVPLESQFAEVASVIKKSRVRAFAAANAVVVHCYWQVGEYISGKISKAQWGDGVVTQLAAYLARVLPDPRGFSDKNLWRMMQFYDLYSSYRKLSTLLRELSWSSHLHIMSKTRTHEERLFYLTSAVRERFTVRELERFIDSDAFERSVKTPAKLSTVLRELHPAAETIFRDSYTLDFLRLSEEHSEWDLRKGIVRNLKEFILEFGRDFAFVGEEYRVQVGMKDFSIDLLFYHRELQCLVAFELKIEEFMPEHLGKLSFYLEALDRNVKKPHEKPSIGIVLCKGRDAEVVEYALARTSSPAAIADYRTKLPGREVLQEKLHELFDSSVREMRAEYGEAYRPA
jgi:predicted nuclease of restriction endonuclease-like (RecB) superfamily